MLKEQRRKEKGKQRKLSSAVVQGSKPAVPEGGMQGRLALWWWWWCFEMASFHRWGLVEGVEALLRKG